MHLKNLPGHKAPLDKGRMTMTRRKITLFLFLFILGQWSFASSEKFQTEILIRNQGIPWGMTFLNSDQLLFTEREGKLKILNTKSKKIILIKGAPDVRTGGQGGLLDVAFYQDWVYLSYSKKTEAGGTTAVGRGKLKNNSLVDFQEIWFARPSYSEKIHYGSRIVFDQKGHLYVSVGDRGNRKYAQDLNRDNGKIHRLKVDGSIPKDNPFPGKTIWSYGHRNPQGLYYNSASELLFEQEHGPRGGDEINIIKKGANYGWPIITYGKEYWGPGIGEGVKKTGMEQPLKYYVPSIAPSGLVQYSGKVFKQWKDALLNGALKLEHINLLLIKDNKVVEEKRLLEKFSKRIRNVIEGPDGLIYFSTDQGDIGRLAPQVNDKKSQKN